jgi:glycosyltransferase involved in cell wall biosynthesis
MISYAGKMSKSKGIPEFLQALRVLSQDPDLPPFEVTLAGGCQDESIKRELDDLPECIHWAGQIAQEHLADVFRYSDIFVLPSYYEGLPLVLIEAMASGAIPVSTDIPGVRPWIEANVPGQNARFIPMPEMQSIDTPTEAGKEKFTQCLIETLRELITGIADNTVSRALPDTSGITWSGVAERIISI